MVKGGHTGTTLYLTASLLSHKTANPGNSHRCHSHSLEGLLSVPLTGSHSSRPRMPTFALFNKSLALSNFCTGETNKQKICATSQQGPYYQVRSSGVPLETSPALQTGQEVPSFQPCILAAGEHCGSFLEGYWGFCRWQGSRYKEEPVLSSAECLWAQLEVLPKESSLLPKLALRLLVPSGSSNGTNLSTSQVEKLDVCVYRTFCHLLQFSRASSSICSSDTKNHTGEHFGLTLKVNSTHHTPNQPAYSTEKQWERGSL